MHFSSQAANHSFVVTFEKKNIFNILFCRKPKTDKKYIYFKYDKTNTNTFVLKM